MECPAWRENRFLSVWLWPRGGLLFSMGRERGWVERVTPSYAKRILGCSLRLTPLPGQMKGHSGSYETLPKGLLGQPLRINSQGRGLQRPCLDWRLLLHKDLASHCWQLDSSIFHTVSIQSFPPRNCKDRDVCLLTNGLLVI